MFNSVSNSVSSWLGATKPDDEDTDTVTEVPNSTETAKDLPPNKDCPSNDDAQADEKSSTDASSTDIQHQLDEIGTKAVTTAKEWGSTCTI